MFFIAISHRNEISQGLNKSHGAQHNESIDKSSAWKGPKPIATGGTPDLHVSSFMGEIIRVVCHPYHLGPSTSWN